MILVKIELHSARTGKVTELGRMQICNTGTTTSDNPKRGDYEVSLFRKGSTTKVQRKGLVRDYPRLSYTVWELVRRALECTLGKWPIHPGRPEEFDEDVASFYKGSEHESAVAHYDKFSDLTWLKRFCIHLYRHNRPTALEAENQLLAEDGVEPISVSFGATKPDRNGFVVGKQIEPGVVSEDFKDKCRALGLEIK